MRDVAIDTSPRAIPAAQYVRMSTEHQRYSLEYQNAANAAYATEHGYEIVRTYSDAGVSGLRIEGRTALKQLLADVLTGHPGFTVVLTYDVSRWGRFQDPDQAAHYEFLCKDAGVPVVYCAEPFENDGSLPSTLVKQLKRAMAAEYSRELSVRISRVHRGLASKGLWVGGPPGYGLRRETVPPDGSEGETLEVGRRKSIASHGVRLAPGPDHERALVRRIHRLFLYAGMSRVLIAQTLNEEHEPAAGGAVWTPHRVDLVLFDEKYVGTAVYGKTSAYLGRGKQRHPKIEWVCIPDAFEAIVDRNTFELTRRNAGRRRRGRVSDAEMLAELETLLTRTGRLSNSIIDGGEGVGTSQSYRRRFGSLLEAYERIGYAPSSRASWGARRGAGRHHRKQHADMSDEMMLAGLRKLYAIAGHMSVRTIEQAPGLPGYWRFRQRFGSMSRLYELVGHLPTSQQTRGNCQVNSAEPQKPAPTR